MWFGQTNNHTIFHLPLIIPQPILGGGRISNDYSSIGGSNKTPHTQLTVLQPGAELTLQLLVFILRKTFAKCADSIVKPVTVDCSYTTWITTIVFKVRLARFQACCPQRRRQIGAALWRTQRPTGATATVNYAFMISIQLTTTIRLLMLPSTYPLGGIAIPLLSL